MVSTQKHKEFQKSSFSSLNLNISKQIVIIVDKPSLYTILRFHVILIIFEICNCWTDINTKNFLPYFNNM